MNSNQTQRMEAVFDFEPSRGTHHIDESSLGDTWFRELEPAWSGRATAQNTSIQNASDFSSFILQLNIYLGNRVNIDAMNQVSQPDLQPLAGSVEFERTQTDQDERLLCPVILDATHTEPLSVQKCSFV